MHDSPAEKVEHVLTLAEAVLAWASSSASSLQWVASGAFSI